MLPGIKLWISDLLYPPVLRYRVRDGREVAVYLCIGQQPSPLQSAPLPKQIAYCAECSAISHQNGLHKIRTAAPHKSRNPDNVIGGGNEKRDGKPLGCEV